MHHTVRTQRRDSHLSMEGARLHSQIQGRIFILHVNFPTQIPMSMILQLPCSDGNLATKFLKICILQGLNT
jgi:hypothetical protein